jgi:hypothetical protein
MPKKKRGLPRAASARGRSVKYDPSRSATYSVQLLRGRLRRPPAPIRPFPFPSETFGAPDDPSAETTASLPQGGPQAFGGYVAVAPAKNAVALFELYRSINYRPRPDDDVELRCIGTHRLIDAYIHSTFAIPFHAARRRGSLRFNLKRYPSVAAVLRRLERAINADDGEAWHRAWRELSPRGQQLLDVAFRWEFRKQRWHPTPNDLSFEIDGTLLDRQHPYRPPLLISFSLSVRNSRGERVLLTETPIPKDILVGAMRRTIKWNARRRRPRVDEKDEAAADLVAVYCFLTGEHPHQLGHSAGSSRRVGGVFDFVAQVERLYGVPLLSAHSGAGWARVLARVQKRLGDWAGG